MINIADEMEIYDRWPPYWEEYARSDGLEEWPYPT
jgi:hypothetical protein